MSSKKSRSSKHSSVRKLGKVGIYSYSVTIPKKIIQDLGWRQRQRLVVSQEGDEIVIRDWEKRSARRT